jgi:hypothetical protein
VPCGIHIKDLVIVVGYKPLDHESFIDAKRIPTIWKMETCVGIKVCEKHIQSKFLNNLDENMLTRKKILSQMAIFHIFLNKVFYTKIKYENNEI